MCSDEGGESLAGGVRLAGGGRTALAAVLPDEGAVLVHTSCKGHACSGRYKNDHARYMVEAWTKKSNYKLPYYLLEIDMMTNF